MQRCYQECNDTVLLLPALRQSRWAAEFRTVCTPSWSWAAVPALPGWCTAGWGSPWGRGFVRSDSSRQCLPGGCWWRRSPLWGRHRSGRSHGWPDQVLYGINQKHSHCEHGIPSFPGSSLALCCHTVHMKWGESLEGFIMCTMTYCVSGLIYVEFWTSKALHTHPVFNHAFFVSCWMPLSMTARSLWKAHPSFPLHQFSHLSIPSSILTSSNYQLCQHQSRSISRIWHSHK